jgi:hypothetical protein
MHYTELLRGVNAYATNNKNDKNNERRFPVERYEEEKIRDIFYSELIEYKGIPLEKAIIHVLSAWNQRVPVDEMKLNEAVRNVPDTIKKWDIVKIDLWKNHSEITKIFKNFINTAKPNENGRNRKNYTGASKALHIINPRFFIMWDEAIRDRYGCRENEEGYFNFLLRCQKEIEEIISTYERDYQEIAERIYEGPPKSIVKLLDEYNIAKYTNTWI